MMAAPADADLVDRLRRGERAAFRELYARFAQASFGFLLRLAGRRDFAEDLQQEVWLSIARHADRLDAAADPAAFDRAAAGPAPADDPACRDLERALASLPDVHREVLLLVGVEGLDV